MIRFSTFCFGIALAFSAVVGGASPVAAQNSPSVVDVGACAVVSQDGDVTSFAPCERLADDCGPAGCDLYFRWPSGSLTVISSTTSDMAAGVRINGKPAETPGVRPSSVGGTCLRNTVSTRTFCWEPGTSAQARAGNGPEAATLTSQTASTDKTLALMDQMQGLYRLSSAWSCRADQIGMDGGALAVQGDKLMGVESVCTLHQPTAVGTTGAVLTQAECTGEGQTFAEDMVLYRDDMSLTIIRPAGKITWLPCSER